MSKLLQAFNKLHAKRFIDRDAVVSNAICSDDEREKDNRRKLKKMERKFVTDKRLQRAQHEI